MSLIKLKEHLGREPTAAEQVANTLGYCCLFEMVSYTKHISSRDLAQVWGLSYGHICRLRKQAASAELTCTKATKCIAQKSRIK